MESVEQLSVSRTFIWSPDKRELQTYDEEGYDDSAFPTIAAGTVIEQKYEVLSLLGRGGMGAVYRVTHLMLNKDMALKTLRSGNVTDSAWLRFQREAQSIAKINDSGIVQVFDFGIAEAGRPYYTMELLKGESLAERLKRKKRLSIGESIAIFTEVARAMDHAHRLGIIHRDIKPGNIFIENAGARENIKVVDFGLAQLADTRSKESQFLTSVGMVFGSPLYMSPEQALGEPTTERTDIYSFGCSLYYALTGEPPFVSQNSLTTIALRLMEDAPPLVHKAPALTFPARLQGIVTKLLAREAEARFQTFAEVVKEMQSLDKKLIENADSVNLHAGKGRPHLASAPNEKLSLHSATSKSIPDQENSLPPHTFTSLRNRLVWTLGGGLAVCLVGWGAFLYLSQPNKKAAVVTIADKPVTLSSSQWTGLGTVLPVDGETKNLPDLKISELPNGDVAYDFAKSGAPFCKIKDKKGKYQQYYTRIVFPKDEQICVRATDHLSKHPQDIAKLKNGHVYELTFSGDLNWTGAQLGAVSMLTGLKSLVLSNILCKPADLDLIAKLPDLEHLSLSDTGLTGDQLIHMRIPPKIKYLELNGVRRIGPFLDRLAGNRTLQNISLKQCGITTGEVKKLVKMPGLRIITLNNNSLNSADIAPLATMKELQTLGLYGLNLDPSVIETLRPLRYLLKLNIDDSKWSDADRQRLSRALPHCNIVDLPEVRWAPLEQANFDPI